MVFSREEGEVAFAGMVFSREEGEVAFALTFLREPGMLCLDIF